MSRINSKFIVIAISVLLLLYFVIFPMGILLYDSIMLDGAINLENYRNVYSQDVNWRALTNTIELSLGVMIVSVLITFPLAWLVGRTDMPGKKIYRTLLVSSYMIPPYVGAIAWVQLLNPSVGYLNEILKFVFGLDLYYGRLRLGTDFVLLSLCFHHHFPCYGENGPDLGGGCACQRCFSDAYRF